MISRKNEIKQNSQFDAMSCHLIFAKDKSCLTILASGKHSVGSVFGVKFQDGFRDTLFNTGLTEMALSHIKMPKGNKWNLVKAVKDS